MTYLLALDQGTTSSRSIVFEAESGRIVAGAQKELTQIYPKPGWVEHDPMEIWQTQLATAQEALAKAGISAKAVRAIGITNQRETTVLWHRKTGLPVHNAIVWQDRRGEPWCAMLRDQKAMIQERTGLLVDAYFSATKLRWLLDHVPQARAQAQAGELAFGTVDSWLLWQLTGGRVHATDVSNASRTMLCDIHSNQWSQSLLDRLDIPASVLPEVHRSSHVFAETQAAHLGNAIPIGGVAGDQQSALFGQACFSEGMVKNTYGTGCFMLMHTGAQCQTSRNRLLSTRAAQANGQSQFAIEGSVFIGGAVIQWLRDGLQAIRASHEVQALAASVPDTGGVMLVPAFTGLGAPYWQPEARGIITGLTRGTTLAHIARAALESIAYQSAALLQAMSQDAQANQQHPIRELRVDGGACVNDLLMQMQADLLGIPVVRPKITETTALGAAYLAGLSTGVHRDTDELSSLWGVERTFFPTLASDRAAEMMSRWEMAVKKSQMGN